MTAEIGALTLPVPAGTLNDSLQDPTLAALLDFFGFYLQECLNEKLTQMQGTTHDACPVENRFQYDPKAYFVRNPLPALYMWSPKAVTQARSILDDMLVRDVRLVWIFQELQYPEAGEPRTGLLHAAESAIQLAASRKYHPEFNNGIPIFKSIPILGLQLNETVSEMYSPVPAVSTNVGGAPEGHWIYAFPVVEASLTVWERIVENFDEDSYPNNKTELEWRTSELDPLSPGVTIREDDNIF